ncbi:MAG: hypothetical protein ACLQDM_29720, partial [Bradyrhizobium sp.]
HRASRSLLRRRPLICRFLTAAFVRRSGAISFGTSSLVWRWVANVRSHDIAQGAHEPERLALIWSRTFTFHFFAFSSSAIIRENQ